MNDTILCPKTQGIGLIPRNCAKKAPFFGSFPAGLHKPVAIAKPVGPCYNKVILV